MDKNARINIQCMQFKVGHCWYGKNCKFSHENGDQINVSKNWNEGNCKIISKVKPCRRFLSSEGCPYGQKCHFSHKEPGASFRMDFSLNNENLGFSGNGYGRSDDRKTRLCQKWEKTGSCSYGMACIYAHGQEELYGYERGNRKTRLCHMWEEMGSCPYETSCNYAHGQEEMRRFCSQLESHQKAVSSSRIQSLAAAPRGSNCGTSNGSAREKDKKHLFKLKSLKQLIGIYADWMDEMEI